MLYIITAVHNRVSITKEFIGYLKKQTYKNWKLIIVDDGSTDGTSDMIETELNNAIIIKGNGNLWWGGSLQKAYKWIMKNADGCDYVYICNDDIIIEPDFIMNGISDLEKDKHTLVTGTGYEMSTGKLGDGARYIDFKTGNETYLPENSSGNTGTTRSLFLTVDAFKRIGGFHPVLLPHYGSDSEFVMRACRKGYKITSFDNLRYYYNDETTGVKKKSLRTMFSKRSTYNPFYFFNLIMFTTPARYIPGRLLRMVKRITK